MSEWTEHCEQMEANSPALHDFMQTWGPHCGAPRSVFLGHLCKLLEEMEKENVDKGVDS